MDLTPCPMQSWQCGIALAELANHQCERSERSKPGTSISELPVRYQTIQNGPNGFNGLEHLTMAGLVVFRIP